MNRRDLLKTMGLAGAAFTLPSFLAFSPGDELSAKTKSGHINVTLGKLELLIVSDGFAAFNFPQTFFAPGIDPELVKRQLYDIFLPENKIEVSVNVMVIKQENRIILIDTGFGPDYGLNCGWLSENLIIAGIQPSAITDVFITHAHVDHIGGILDKNDNLTYQNARYHIAKKEFDFWMGDNPDFSKSKNTSSSEPDILLAKKVLGKIQDKLEFFNYGDELFSCLKTELAEGHTPGHTLFTLSSENKQLKHLVDITHSTLLMAQPEWGIQLDADFNKAVKTRKIILEKAAKKRELVISTHIPWPGIGYIYKIGTGYEWKPFSYPNPREIII
ncbi:hypothetical protein TH53_15475 [Pedobacter lusitanus]|uniref:Metallo-beta-lactamase domain-containing protein n=1 Tax=Pedobacter lusitanus TaxID=1503925 RepID=A0A0D0GJR6_9SPHI|nr:MBL fold metallo-hydrolase [Pedobacter lusitanus]KIO76350.1 hypothetical protein TH53_15475 [Pedobacter lusitanus]